MIRPIDWRDFALIHRIGENGICLDAQLAATRGPSTLQRALLGSLIPGQNICTLIDRPEDDAELPVLGQFHLQPGGSIARLAFLGPAPALGQQSAALLIDALVRAAGEQGALNLVADVDEDGAPFEVLRHAGFAIYARQRLWCLEPPTTHDPGRPAERWRREHPSDRSAVQSLYFNLVPGLVQQVEPPPAEGRGMVHWGAGELLGYLEMERGPRGTWIHPYFHPAAEHLSELFTDLILQLAASGERHLFVNVRSYQGWMNSVLERLGFTRWQDQSVMVKRLAASVRRPALSPLSALENTSPEPTAPFAPSRADESPQHAGEWL